MPYNSPAQSFGTGRPHEPERTDDQCNAQSGRLPLPRLYFSLAPVYGVRTNDNGVMAPAAKNLTDEQIEALAHYLTGL
jgi:cytochrome c553